MPLFCLGAGITTAKQGHATNLASNTVTATIQVTAVDDAPTPGNQSLTLAEDSLLTGNLLVTAKQPSGFTNHEPLPTTLHKENAPAPGALA